MLAIKAAGRLIWLTLSRTSSQTFMRGPCLQSEVLVGDAYACVPVGDHVGRILSQNPLDHSSIPPQKSKINRFVTWLGAANGSVQLGWSTVWDGEAAGSAPFGAEAACRRGLGRPSSVLWGSAEPERVRRRTPTPQRKEELFSWPTP